jgi:hypothetical protein
LNCLQPNIYNSHTHNSTKAAQTYTTHTPIIARRLHSSHRLKHALIQCTTTFKVCRLHHKTKLVSNTLKSIPPRLMKYL